MKILILGKYFPPFEGGIEKYVYDISRKLVQEKNCVWVIVSNTEKKYSFEKIEGINLIRVPRSIYFLRGFLTPPIINIVKKINPDIIHLNVPNPWFEINILLFCIFYRKKIFITYHSDIINYTPFHAILNFFRFFEFFFISKFFTNKIIVTSREYIQSSIFLKYNRNKIVVLPSPLEIEKFKPKKLKNRKIKKIFFVGRLVNYKGLQYLIKSASILKKKRNDFRVYIIGDGPLKDFLIKITKRFNLEKFVIFLGKLRNDDVIKLLKKDCDIFVLPSVYRSEALGMSMVEAMAIGIPVVSTKIKGSGVVFVNKNNITGFVVEPRNSLKLAQALDKLLNDFELRKKFGQNGRKRTLKLFNLNSYVKKLIKIYKVI